LGIYQPLFKDSQAIPSEQIIIKQHDVFDKFGGALTRLLAGSSISGSYLTKSLKRLLAI